MRRLILVLSLLVLVLGDVRAQPAHALVDIKEDWSGASWIWRDGDNVGNVWVAFRKQFDIASVPGEAIASIAVDSKYWLWINGQIAIREGALKRGPTPNDTYYEEVDLAPYLQPGQNTIAILVWYWGRSGYSHMSSDQGGLLFEASVGGQTIVSDPSWQVRRLLAFKESRAPASNFRLPERNIAFASEEYPEAWMQPSFNSTQWPAATIVGTAAGPPWNRLYKRPVPQWRWSEILPYENNSALLGVSTGDTLVAILPDHAQVTPWFRIRAAAGDTVDMRTDRYLVPSIDGVSQINTIRTDYITKDGEQEFETFAWMNGEKVLYHFPAGIEILDVGYRESGFDTDFVGTFETDDPFFNTLWLKARETVYGTMRDYFMETAGRERKQASADGSRALLSALYSMDARARTLMRKFWSEFSDWRAPNGAILSGIPGNWEPELPQQNLVAYGEYGLWRYYLVTGDLELLETVYPHVRQYLLLWDMEPSGLVAHRAGDWDFFDWEFNIDETLMENAMYQVALRTAVKMAIETGNTQDIPEWERRMESIHSAVNELMWTGNFYRAPDHPGGPDDRGNAIAYLANLHQPGFVGDINRVLRNSKHSSPYMDHFAVRALFEIGDADGALARLRDRYADMVNSDLTTLTEWFDPTIGSKEHPFATGTLRLLTNRVAGIEPVEPGFTRAVVEPAPGPLRRVSASTMTNLGMLEMDLDRPVTFEEGLPAQTLRLVVPEGMTVRLGIPKPPGVLARIEARDQIVWLETEPFETVDGVRPLIETDTFVRFEVAPGAWEFDLYVKPVPAQFAEVQAQAVAGGAEITWSTLAERDGTEFIVEEKFDTEFVPVGVIEPDDARDGSYVFQIGEVMPGFHTFRVKAIGTEGGIAFSPEITLEVPGESSIALSSLYPNPVDVAGTFTVSVSEAQDVTGAVFDALGRQVKVVFESFLEPGQRYRYRVPVSDLPSGMYALVLKGSDSTVKPFVVAR